MRHVYIYIRNEKATLWHPPPTPSLHTHTTTIAVNHISTPAVQPFTPPGAAATASSTIVFSREPFAALLQPAARTRTTLNDDLDSHLTSDRETDLWRRMRRGRSGRDDVAIIIRTQMEAAENPTSTFHSRRLTSFVPSPFYSIWILSMGAQHTSSPAQHVTPFTPSDDRGLHGRSIKAEKETEWESASAKRENISGMAIRRIEGLANHLYSWFASYLRYPRTPLLNSKQNFHPSGNKCNGFVNKINKIIQNEGIRKFFRHDQWRGLVGNVSSGVEMKVDDKRWPNFSPYEKRVWK